MPDQLERVPRESAHPSGASVGRSFLIGLLAIDGILIGLDAMAGGGPQYPESLHVYTEGGVPEWFQYAKYLVGAGAMFLLVRRRSDALYGVWAAIFLYLFADDAFMLHERVADHTARLLRVDEWAGLPFYAWIVIEPIYMTAVAIAMLAALWYAARRSASAIARRFTVQVVVLLVILGGFAVVGDVIGRLVFEQGHLAEVVEDAGEMLLASLLIARAVHQIHIEAAWGPFEGRTGMRLPPT